MHSRITRIARMSRTVVALSIPRVPELASSAVSTRYLLFIKEIRVQHWCRVRLSSSRSRHKTREVNHRRHRLCSILRDRHFTRICRRAVRACYRRDCRYCHDRRCRCRAVRRDCGRRGCDLDLRRRRRCRISIRSGTQYSFAAVFAVLIRTMSGQPSESIPTTNTRRRAADRCALAGSSSSVESDRQMLQ